MPAQIIAVTSHNIVSCANARLADALNETLSRMQADGSRKAAWLKYGDTADAEQPPALQPPKQLC